MLGNEGVNGFQKMSAEGVNMYSMCDGEGGFTLLASKTHVACLATGHCSRLANRKPEKYKASFFIGKSEIGLGSGVLQATTRP